MKFICALPPLGGVVVRPLAFHLQGRGFDSQAGFLSAIRTQSSCEKSESLRSVQYRGFPPGTPVSSHRESRQGGLGNTGPQQLAHAAVISLPLWRS